MVSLTIHQVYDAYIRAVEYCRDTNFEKEFFDLNVAFPAIGKNEIPRLSLEFQLKGRELILLTKVEIVHIFSKIERYGEQEIKKKGTGKFYEKTHRNTTI